jgi:hypothetical protein
MKAQAWITEKFWSGALRNMPTMWRDKPIVRAGVLGKNN